jgi:hypothetical protein
MTSVFSNLDKLFNDNSVSNYINLINSLPTNQINTQLANLYNSIPNDDFFNVIKGVHKNLSPDQYTQKLVDLYKLYPITNIYNNINTYYQSLDNIIKFENITYKLSTFISQKQPTDKSVTLYLAPTPVPSFLDLRNQLTPVRDQGPDGCCVAFALCSMKEFLNIKGNYYKNYLSPWFIYLQRSNSTTEGMYPKNALDILKNKGVTTELYFPYRVAKSKSDITQKDYFDAENFKISDYALVNSINDLKQALHQSGPCIIAFPCYNSSPTFWKQNSGDKLLGGHCVLVVGFDSTKGFLIRNSWGNNWANNGYTWFAYSDWGIQNEIWSSLDFVDPNRKQFIDNIVIQENSLNNISTTPVPQSNSSSGYNNIAIIIIIIIILIIIGFCFYYFTPKKQIIKNNIIKNNIIKKNI